MKEYNRFIKEVEKNNDYKIIKTGRKTTIKVVHKSNGRLYSVHPGDNAIRPLKNWMNKNK